MSDSTGIEWTDATWNPVRGCERVSPGCENCYAERVAARFSGPGMPYEGLAIMGANGPRWTREVAFISGKLDQPLRWRKPRRIFVNSMSDLFQRKLDVRDIDQVFAVMALSPQHTFQVLTKRADRMRAYLNDPNVWPRVSAAAHAISLTLPKSRREDWLMISPLPNVWLGVSAEDQQRADERIPLLLETPAAVRFVSYEPALGPVDLGDYLPVCREKPGTCGAAQQYHCGCQYPTQLHWVIAGAESGHGARPMNEDWVRSVRDQCAAAGTAFFYKQRIETALGTGAKKVALPVLDGVQHMGFPR